MITKAIVEEVLTPHQVRVRIPILDRPDFTPLSVKTENLNIATICTLPSCYVNLQVGDVVFVGFEDNTVHKVVVLGHLSREATTTHASMILSELQVGGTATLNYDTHIGEVTPAQLAALSHVREDIQKQIDMLKERQEKIYSAIFPEE